MFELGDHVMYIYGSMKYGPYTITKIYNSIVNGSKRFTIRPHNKADLSELSTVRAEQLELYEKSKTKVMPAQIEEAIDKLIIESEFGEVSIAEAKANLYETIFRFIKE